MSHELYTTKTSDEMRDEILRLTGVKFSKSECRRYTFEKILTIALKVENKKEMVEEGLDGY